MRGHLYTAAIVVIAAGCNPSESSKAPAESGGEKVSEASGPLLRTEFEVTPTFGEYRAIQGDFVYSLEVTDKGSCSLSRTEESGKEPVQMFSGRSEPTFDGIRCAISRVNGKRQEAEAFFKVTDSGYDFKTASLLGDMKIPKSFATPK